MAPRWRPDLDRLTTFLEALPSDEPQVIEIRDRRWYGTQLSTILEGAAVALCLHDMHGSAPRPNELARSCTCAFMARENATVVAIPRNG